MVRRTSRRDGHRDLELAKRIFPETVTTEIGQVDLSIPRDSRGSFEPVTLPYASEDGLAGRTLIDAAAEEDASSMTTVDERTDEEIAIDKLDLMMVQVGIFEVGVTDIDVIQRASDCVVQRLESENIEFTGEGTAELIWP